MSELIRRQGKLSSGAVYEVTGFRGKVDGFNIDFIGWRNAMPFDQNEGFTLRDLNDIAKKVLPGVPRNKIKIRAHSCAGMNVTIKEGIPDSGA